TRVDLQNSGTIATEVRLQQSFDLKIWQNSGTKEIVRGASVWRRTIDANKPEGFFRLVTQPRETFTSRSGDKILGYAGAFDDELAAVRSLSLSDFAKYYSSTNSFLPSISWDLSTAVFWRNWVKYHPPFLDGKDFSLNPKELEFMLRN